MFSKVHLFLALFVMSSVACQQAPTEVMETDANLSQRRFSKIEHGKEVNLKRSVIIDVRPRFEFEMSKLPRSFHAYWKDWDLRGLRGRHLDKRRRELQRLLSIHGIDPLTQVVIIGPGLSGQGEEFLVTSTLMALGVKRVQFISKAQVKKALTAKNTKPIENAPSWEEPIGFDIHCELVTIEEEKRRQAADIIIEPSSHPERSEGSFTPEQLFTKQLEVIPQSFPKNLNTRVYSPGSLWAYGLALYFMEQVREPCVL